MLTRRDFIHRAAAFTASSMLPYSLLKTTRINNIGVQLYSFRDAMAKNPVGTLKMIADIGFKEIESARSRDGHYYGLSPAEMKKACQDLGMTLRSGHVHLDKQWEKTMDEAAESGQEYLICSTMPSNGQTVDNYKRVAEAFNKAGEECKSRGLKFGYHNHEYEFESEGGQVLYDVLMDHTEPDLVHMELDLGWVVVAGKDPLDYFDRYTGRFPLWHLKDMNMQKKESTEFGKGGLDIKTMLQSQKASGVKYIFVEQEEYAVSPEQSMRDNLAYLDRLKY
ncbi:sugar phosphate isomerase/epimerase family protein [Fulvivirga sedimenti]|uniref:Sugar phosphate isomerase/epimerase n=1 Tax=Fulvivirga sedimenti TaxID=2879465 RepID=A0A9X1HXG4_9BACT|nr:sugar phosphate isomerase/epimerase [Fulvivirga sedimenti]MCA6078833.1 sugar phosphate isomerase/epimerase [Fulvivirga sedimenti]